MPMPKHREPLVKKAVSVAVRQWDALEERARAEDRSVSHFVREAIDGYLEADQDKDLAAPDAEKLAVPA